MIGWKKVKLSDLGKILTGNTPSTKCEEYYNSNDVMFIKPDDLRGNTLNKINTSKAYISSIGAGKSRNIPAGSILVTCIGIIGKVAIVENEACFNQQINAIIPDNNIVNSKFLGYAILKYNYLLKAVANAPIVPIINKTQFRDIEIKIPPLEIQDKIVEVLERADKALEKRKESIRLLDELVKSRFIEMFGDPVTNSKGWNKEKLSDLGELARGKSKHRPRNAPELLNGPYPLIQTGDIAKAGIYLKEYTQTYSELGLKQSKMWKKGTLCITIAANIAKTSILTFDACFPDSVVAFIPSEKTNNMFIQFWMSFLQKILEDSAPESAQKNINLKILSEQNVIVPPLELQKQFADFVKQVDKLKFEMENSLKELENNFNSLMQRAFKGELF